jgi:hypothetical protein
MTAARSLNWVAQAFTRSSKEMMPTSSCRSLVTSRRCTPHSRMAAIAWAGSSSSGTLTMFPRASEPIRTSAGLKPFASAPITRSRSVTMPLTRDPSSVRTDTTRAPTWWSRIRHAASVSELSESMVTMCCWQMEPMFMAYSPGRRGRVGHDRIDALLSGLSLMAVNVDDVVCARMHGPDVTKAAAHRSAGGLRVCSGRLASAAPAGQASARPLPYSSFAYEPPLDCART